MSNLRRGNIEDIPYPTIPVYASIAQWREQWITNPQVADSNPARRVVRIEDLGNLGIPLKSDRKAYTLERPTDMEATDVETDGN